MKKITALILALLLVFALTACGDEEVPAPPSPTEAPSFTIGTVEGQTYENPFVGLGISFPEAWVFATEEEIAELNNIALDLVGDDYRELIEQSDIVYAMSASKETLNVNINFENISAYKDQITSAAVYRDVGLEQYEAVWTEMGGEVLENKALDIQIGDNSYAGMTTTMSYMDQTISQTGVYILCGDHVCCITITADTPEQCEEILSYFYALN